MQMTDPRTPSGKAREAQLPDDLNQNPVIDETRGLSGQHGSEDAQLLAGANDSEGHEEAEAANVLAETGREEKNGDGPDDLASSAP